MATTDPPADETLITPDFTIPHRDVHSLHIYSDIKYRYATTLVTSRIINPVDVTQKLILLWLCQKLLSSQVLPCHLEKMWAYLTLQQLMDNITIHEGRELNDTKRKALDLALQYSFATPLTSFIIVKSDSTSATGPQSIRPSVYCTSILVFKVFASPTLLCYSENGTL